MPTKQYNIYVKGILAFTKYTEREFKKVCADMDFSKVSYKTEIINL